MSERNMLCCALLLLAVSGRIEASWITAGDYGRLEVVVADGASEEDRMAAAEFSKYWELATGHAISVVSTPSGRFAAWIGVKGAPPALVQEIDWEQLIPDGVRIRSLASGHALFVGAGERGALNAVYEFFERFIGVRWLGPDATFVPRPPTEQQPASPAPWERFTPESLPELDFSHTPVFEYRWTRHNRDYSGEFARHHRLTQSPGFGLWVHTFFRLLPPEEYFEAHPEYYSEINGERVAPVGLSHHDYWVDVDLRREHGHRFAQLCVTNPDVVEEVSRNLLNMIRSNPEPRIWSVSQEDWDGYCECDRCAAETKAEGTPMGPLLRFVNAVAERVEREFPDHFVETLAYTWSRQLPKTVRPRENVIIRLCSIECDFARPLNDPDARENRLFARDIRDWAGAARQLYIWDYVVNFHHYHLPHPNLNVLQQNVQFFANNNVRGLFEQGLGAPHVELGHIRPYLLARLLWNPWLDYEACKNEFIDLFFQESGAHYREYLDLIHRAVIEKNWTMDTFDSGGWIDKALIDEARAIFDRALDAAPNDVIRERVRYERLAVEYAALVARPTLHIDGDTARAEWPESMSVPDYIELARSFGVPEYAERRPIETLSDAVTTRTAHEREVPVEILENERHLLWIVPEIEGSVLRWRDKQMDRELLRGYEFYGARPGTWQDWHNMPLTPEGPAAHTYAVVERSSSHLILEGVREDGLVVRREMRLDADSQRIEIALELHNPTDGPLEPSVKIHPEFYDQSGAIPEIWGRKNDVWIRLDRNDTRPERIAAGDYLPVEGFSGLAFRAGDAALTVVCEFDPQRVGSLLWFYNASANARQVNLELMPKAGTLQPGESRSVAGVYYTTETAPAEL